MSGILPGVAKRDSVPVEEDRSKEASFGRWEELRGLFVAISWHEVSMTGPKDM